MKVSSDHLNYAVEILTALEGVKTNFEIVLEGPAVFNILDKLAEITYSQKEGYVLEFVNAS